MGRVLKDWAQAYVEEFELEYLGVGCSCWQSAPCSRCTHPGNPLCLEDDEYWTYETFDDMLNSMVQLAQQRIAQSVEALTAKHMTEMVFSWNKGV